MKIFIFSLLLFFHSFSFGQTENILYITMRKSGTHLLEKCLNYLLCKNDDYQKIENLIEKRFVTPGCIGKNTIVHFQHMDYLRQLENNNRLDSIKKIVLIRDPRDVLISSAYFVEKMPLNGANHLLGYRNAWKNIPIEKKIDSLLTFEDALYPNNKLPGFIAIHSNQFHLAPKFLDMPNTLVIRFEDLVGEPGGGSNEAQYIALYNIAEFLDVPFDENIYEKMSQYIFGSTRTFRSGQIGSWKQYLSNKQKDLFKEQYQQDLIALGYEESSDW